MHKTNLSNKVMLSAENSTNGKNLIVGFKPFD